MSDGFSSTDFHSKSTTCFLYVTSNLSLVCWPFAPICTIFLTQVACIESFGCCCTTELLRDRRRSTFNFTRVCTLSSLQRSTPGQKHAECAARACTVSEGFTRDWSEPVTIRSAATSVMSLTAVCVSHVTLSVGNTSCHRKPIVSNAIGVTGKRSKSSQFKIAEP